MKQIPVSAIARHVDPFRDHPRSVEVTRAQVFRALAENRLESRPGTDNHAERIAYLVVNRAEDPIQLEVGIPGCAQRSSILWDGHHRLAAAMFRGERFMLVEVSGSLDEAERLFGVLESRLESAA